MDILVMCCSLLISAGCQQRIELRVSSEGFQIIQPAELSTEATSLQGEMCNVDVKMLCMFAWNSKETKTGWLLKYYKQCGFVSKSLGDNDVKLITLSFFVFCTGKSYRFKMSWEWENIFNLGWITPAFNCVILCDCKLSHTLNLSPSVIHMEIITFSFRHVTHIKILHRPLPISSFHNQQSWAGLSWGLNFFSKPSRITQ